MNKKTIQKLVKASGVVPGELILVHFWGEDKDKDIANDFMAAVAEAGATPVLLQQSRTVNRDIFLHAGESCFDEHYFSLLSGFDAVLDIFAYQPVVLGFDIGEQQLALYRRYMAQLFGKLMECKRFTQIRLPTEANAGECGLDAWDFVHRMEQAYDIDYDALKSACEDEAKRFFAAKAVSMHTGKDCVLLMELEGRNWHIDAGDGDLPCGEIYTAPQEYKTQGNVFFDELWFKGTNYGQTTLEVRNGKVCACDAPKLWELLSEQPEESRVVCELGIGLNPNVTELCGYTVLDEKAAGTFHIALGANDMFGGTNSAPDHVDLVGRGEIRIEG